jgi:hypothetical protein
MLCFATGILSTTEALSHRDIKSKGALSLCLCASAVKCADALCVCLALTRARQEV